MVDLTQRHDKFITDLAAQCTWLNKAQMMGIGWFARTYETWLSGYKSKMILVAMATRYAEHQIAFVNSSPLILGSGARLCRVSR